MGERLRLPHCPEAKRVPRVGLYPGNRLGKVSNDVGIGVRCPASVRSGPNSCLL